MNNRIPRQPQPMQSVLQVAVTCMVCLREFFVSRQVPPGMAFIPPAKHQLRGICGECNRCPSCGIAKRILSFNATPEIPHAALLCVECGHTWHGPKHNPNDVPTAMEDLSQ